jgi:hypothetical protein
MSAAQTTEMKSAPKIPMQLISGGNTRVTPDRHWERFAKALVELAKIVLFGMAWALAMRVLLWPVSLARIFPLLFLCGMPLGLFSLVVFNRWRLYREFRKLAWQQWIDCVSPIARQYGVESAVIRLSDRWRNYFERGLSPERALSQYKSDCMAGRFDDEVSQNRPKFFNSVSSSFHLLWVRFTHLYEGRPALSAFNCSNTCSSDKV